MRRNWSAGIASDMSLECWHWYLRKWSESDNSSLVEVSCVSIVCLWLKSSKIKIDEELSLNVLQFLKCD